MHLWQPFTFAWKELGNVCSDKSSKLWKNIQNSSEGQGVCNGFPQCISATSSGNHSHGLRKGSVSSALTLLRLNHDFCCLKFISRSRSVRRACVSPLRKLSLQFFPSLPAPSPQSGWSRFVALAQYLGPKFNQGFYHIGLGFTSPICRKWNQSEITWAVESFYGKIFLILISLEMAKYMATKFVCLYIKHSQGTCILCFVALHCNCLC